QKLQKREAIRLELSVKQAIELGGKEICAFLHYPPIYGNFENYEIIDVLQKYKIKRCFYGHLHGAAHKYAVSGIHYGIEFTLVSADFVGFKPIKVKNS
ncbi:MAG: serine/threonine protein phosphatase, partial [Oscillospiraceae bacterium]|nr:serine/threonine protein phosphatase [Oscillospiraceae bacterium]